MGNLPYNIVTSQYLKRAPYHLDDDEVAQIIFDWFVDNVIKKNNIWVQH